MPKQKLLLGAAAAVALIVAVAGGAWYLFLRDDAPPPVNLRDAVEDLGGTPTAAASPGTTPETQASPTAAANASLQSLTGTWEVLTSADAFVGYRVKEELANVGFTTAVGRTSDVNGTFEISGTTLQAATIEANLAALRSDRSFRDNALRSQALETGRFPTATFTLTSPVEIPAGLLEGQGISTTLVGELTLHGVTRAVEIPVEAQVVGTQLVAVGSLEILFADYDIAQPRAQAVLSVEDRGVMEFQLAFAAR